MAKLADYRKTETKAAQAQTKAYATARNKQAKRDYTAQAAAINAARKKSVQSYQKQIKEAKQAYQGQLDTNAVQAMIDRRQVAQTLADIGLTNSGLNRTQQTAINVGRSTADAAVRRQRQTAVEALRTKIAEAREQAAISKQTAKSELTAAAREDIEAYRQKQLTAAEKRAQTSYNASLKSTSQTQVAVDKTVTNALKRAENAEKQVKALTKRVKNLKKQTAASTLEERRAKYATVLIQHDHTVEYAWKEAYRVYPDPNKSVKEVFK